MAVNLFFDDLIDSGSTLGTVVSTIRSECQKNGFIEPKFNGAFLYNQHLYCWSGPKPKEVNYKTWGEDYLTIEACEGLGESNRNFKAWCLEVSKEP